MSITYMTPEGYEKLKNELDYLVRVRRKEIAKELETARGHGDLRENAEYDAAKEAQAMNERRIAELTQKLAHARVLDDRDVPKDKAYLGARVTVRNTQSGETEVFILVSEAEADFLANKISVKSPIGKGLLGHGVGEVVEVQVPAGLLRFEILEITR